MGMSNDTFKKLVDSRRLQEDLLLSIKGQDYARIYDGQVLGEANRLRNFEVIADLLKGAPVDALTVAAIYWLKHVLAICTYVADRMPGAEPLGSRFSDVNNYSYLLEACVIALTGDAG